MSIHFAPDVSGAAAAVAGQSREDWLILGYHGGRDKLSLYYTGEKGVVEAKTKLTPEVLFCLINIEGRLLLVTYMPEDGVSGVQRARALVHSRAVASAFRHHATFSATSPDDFNLVAFRNRLRLDGQSSVPPSPQGQSLSTFTSPSKFPGPYQLSQATEQPLEKPASPNFSGQGGVPGLVLGNQRATSPSDSGSHSRSNTPDPALHDSTSSQPRPSTPSAANLASTNPNGIVHPSSPVATARASPRPENEWRQATTDRRDSTSNPTALAQAMLAARISSDLPSSARTAENGSRSTEVLDQAQEDQPRVSSEQRERDAEAHHAQAQAQQAKEMQEREDSPRTDRERKERQAAERAREAAEKDARAQWEFERREREKLELAERQRLEQEELARREAAERLRREEQRRAEEKERLEQERIRREEEERTRLAKLEMERLMESQRLEKKLQEEAEVRRKAEQKLKDRAELQQRFADLKSTGEVMLKGHVSAQGGASMLWRRRWFELRGTALALYKSETDTAKAVDSIPLPRRVRGITDNPEEAAMPNSFKLTMHDDDEWLFYTDGADDKELLVAGLSMAAEL